MGGTDVAAGGTGAGGTLVAIGGIDVAVGNTRVGVGGTDVGVGGVAHALKMNAASVNTMKSIRAFCLFIGVPPSCNEAGFRFPDSEGGTPLLCVRRGAQCFRHGYPAAG